MQEINRIRRSNLHYIFNKHLEPVASVESGSIVVFECVDCYSNQITDNNTLFADVNSDLNNPATGPLYVKGAEPGDVLKVKIQKITLADYGVMTARPGAGLYGDLITEFKSKVIQIQNDKAYFSDEIILDLLPMIGVIGTAPNEETLSTWPGEHGGNNSCI